MTKTVLTLKNRNAQGKTVKVTLKPAAKALKGYNVRKVG